MESDGTCSGLERDELPSPACLSRRAALEVARVAGPGGDRCSFSRAAGAASRPSVLALAKPYPAHGRGRVPSHSVRPLQRAALKRDRSVELGFFMTHQTRALPGC